MLVLVSSIISIIFLIWFIFLFAPNRLSSEFIKLKRVLGKGVSSGEVVTASHLCNDGGDDYIEEVIVHSDDFVRGLELKCKNSKDLIKYGSGGNASPVLKGPFNSFEVRVGDLIDNYGGYGGNGGTLVNTQCPEDYVLAGFDIKRGDYISQLTPYCGALKLPLYKTL